MVNIEFSKSGTIPTFQLNDVVISSDAESIYFEFYANNRDLLRGDFFPIKGAVIITGLQELIEQFFHDYPHVKIADCELYASDGNKEVTKTFRTMYCDRSINITELNSWLKNNFLTIAPIRRIMPNGTFILSYFQPKEESSQFSVYVTYLNSEGNKRIFNYPVINSDTENVGDQILTTSFSLKDIVKRVRALNQLQDEVRILSVIIVRGERSATFYVDQSLLSAKLSSFLTAST